MNDFLEKLEISIKEAKNFLRKAELCVSPDVLLGKQIGRHLCCNQTCLRLF